MGISCTHTALRGHFHPLQESFHQQAKLTRAIRIVFISINWLETTIGRKTVLKSLALCSETIHKENSKITDEKTQVPRKSLQAKYGLWKSHILYLHAPSAEKLFLS